MTEIYGLDFRGSAKWRGLGGFVMWQLLLTRRTGYSFLHIPRFSLGRLKIKNGDNQSGDVLETSLMKLLKNSKIQ